MIIPSVPATCQNCPHVHRSLLGSCQPSELDFLAGSKVHRSYRKGQVIFQQGSQTQGLYCVHQGKVKISKVSAEGKERIIRLGKEGDVLGYRSLLLGETYTTAAVALTDCVVCLVPRPDFFSLIGQNARFAQSLTQLLATSLGEAEARLLSSHKPVSQRLAEALLLLYHAFQPVPDALFSMPVSRDDLAALMGATKETASRLLSEFREEGVVATQGSRITVLNLEKLQYIASLYD